MRPVGHKARCACCVCAHKHARKNPTTREKLTGQPDWILLVERHAPDKFRPRVCYSWKLAHRGETFKSGVGLTSSAAAVAAGNKAAGVYGIKPVLQAGLRKNPAATAKPAIRKKYYVGHLDDNRMQVKLLDYTPTASNHPEGWELAMGPYASRAQADAFILKQRRGSNNYYTVVPNPAVRAKSVADLDRLGVAGASALGRKAGSVSKAKTVSEANKLADRAWAAKGYPPSVLRINYVVGYVAAWKSKHGAVLNPAAKKYKVKRNPEGKLRGCVVCGRKTGRKKCLSCLRQDVYDAEMQAEKYPGTGWESAAKTARDVLKKVMR